MKRELHAKIVCPVNIGFNEYVDRLICEFPIDQEELADGLDSVCRGIGVLLSAIAKDAQMRRWGLACRISCGEINLGTLCENGEFYPSEFYDNNPDYLSA